MSFYIYVLEQLVRHKNLIDQLPFAIAAVKLIERIPGLRADAYFRGMKIMAADEFALRRAREILMNRFPEKLDFREPEVIYKSNPPQEPVMRMTIETPHPHEAAVRNWLRARPAQIVAIARGQPRTVIHALAPQSDLLGCDDALRQVASAETHVTLAFSHYQSIDRLHQRQA